LGAEVCTGILKLEVGFTPSVDLTIGGGGGFKTSNTASIGFQWSYSTSGNPWTYFYPLAGESGIVDQQTMYLTPSLNLVYSLSLHVVFDKDVCAAKGTQVTTWSPTSPRNFQVFSSLISVSLVTQLLWVIFL
jgi:hypothetical protein